MKWLRSFIHRLVGRDRYHDQSSEVQTRALRVEILRQRAQVYERRQNPR
jgi:hypothetical protein